MSQNPFQPDDELLSAYIDGELSADELRAVEEWIASDPGAQALVEELRNVSNTVQSLPRAAVPAEWTAQLAQRLDDAAAAPTATDSKHEQNGQAGSIASLPIGRSRRGWWWSAAAIAAAVGIVMLLPQGVNGPAPDHVALKRPAAGREFAPAPTGEPADESVADNELLAEPATAAAEESPLDDLRNDMPEESPLPESVRDLTEPSGVAGARGDSFDSITNASNAYLIVWCEVPPEALREREINNVFGDNGIAVNERTESWATAAVPVRRQIELRNNITMNRGGFGGGGVETDGAVDSLPAGDTARYARTAPRAARSEMSLESRAQPTREAPPTESAAGAEAEANVETEEASRRERDGDDVEIEGETILVDATADQIASCLAAMQSDPGNYASIAVEPVNERTLSEQLAQQRLAGEGASFRGSVADRDQNNDGVAQSSDFYLAAPQAQPQEEKQGDMKQMAKQLQQPQARRLARPEDWYYYNTAPQDKQQFIQLPVVVDKASGQTAASGTKTKINTKGEDDLSRRKSELARLNLLVEEQQQLMPTKILPEPLQEQQPVQVLFVLRNSKLPNPALAADSATTSESGPLEASEVEPTPAAPAPASP